MRSTIIILAYNHESFVRAALRSAAEQTRPADEIIIVDDASSDQTAAVIEEFVRGNPKLPARLLRNQSNLGVSASLMRAVAEARSDFLFLLAGDDISSPDRIEVCTNYLGKHPGAFALITNAEIIDEASQAVGLLDNCNGHTESVSLSHRDLCAGEHFLRGRSSCGATAAYRSAVFHKFSPMRSGLYAEDDPAAFRAMLLGSCDFLPISLVRWRRHGNNLSRGGGASRGPKMASHFRKCEAMVDQMLSDAAEWSSGYPEMTGPGLNNAVTNLRYQKAKWELWAVAHESGIQASRLMSAATKLFAASPSMVLFMQESWRPTCRMFMPFAFQRFMANLRSRP